MSLEEKEEQEEQRANSIAVKSINRGIPALMLACFAKTILSGCVFGRLRKKRVKYAAAE